PDLSWSSCQSLMLVVNQRSGRPLTSRWTSAPTVVTSAGIVAGSPQAAIAHSARTRPPGPRLPAVRPRRLPVRRQVARIEETHGPRRLAHLPAEIIGPPRRRRPADAAARRPSAVGGAPPLPCDGPRPQPPSRRGATQVGRTASERR